MKTTERKQWNQHFDTMIGVKYQYPISLWWYINVFSSGCYFKIKMYWQNTATTPNNLYWVLKILYHRITHNTHDRLNIVEQICLTSLTRAKPKEKNGISCLISTLCVNCLNSIPEYSRIIDYSIIWMCIWCGLLQKLYKIKKSELLNSKVYSKV